MWRSLAALIASFGLISIVLVSIHLSLPVDSEWKLRPEAVGLASLGIGGLILCCLILLGWFLLWGNHWAASHLPGWALWMVGILSVLAQIAAVGAACLAMLGLLFAQDEMRSVRIDGQAYYIERTYPDAGGPQPVWRATDPLRIVNIGALDGENTRITGLDDDQMRQLLVFANDSSLSEQERAALREELPNDTSPRPDDAKGPQDAADPGGDSMPSAPPTGPSMAERCAQPAAVCFESVWTLAPMDPTVVQTLIDEQSAREGGADVDEVSGGAGRWALMTLDAALGSRWTVLVEKVDDADAQRWRFVSEVPTTSMIEGAEAEAGVIELTARSEERTQRLRYLLNANQWEL